MTELKEPNPDFPQFRRREDFSGGLDLPPAWVAAADRWLAQPGRLRQPGLTVVLGAADRGKSTLCRYLLARALEAGLPAAWIDADLGQSHLGPPTTLGLHLYPPGDPARDPRHPIAVYFIGQTSPLGRLAEVIGGLVRLAGQAADRGAERVLVNTSGLVFGPAAQRLKNLKLELLRPALVLALEQERELDLLLAPWQPHLGEALIRLSPSGRAVPKTAAQRRQYRDLRLGRYFRGARRLQVPLTRWSWLNLPWGAGPPLPRPQRQSWSAALETPVLYGETGPSRPFLLLAHPPAAAEARRDLRARTIAWMPWKVLELRLVGLLDADLFTLSLGVMLPSDWERGELALWTPLAAGDLDRVRFCRLGRLHLDLSGRERTA